MLFSSLFVYIIANFDKDLYVILRIEGTKKIIKTIHFFWCVCKLLSSETARPSYFQIS